MLSSLPRLPFRSRASLRQFRTLLAIALAAGAGWGFIELAEVVVTGASSDIDTAILLALRNPADPADPLGPPWLEEAGRDITALGSFAVLALLTFATTGFLALSGKVRLAIVLALGVGLGQLASSLLKLGFARPRPDLVPHGSYVVTTSFPSGHAMMAAVTYLTLGALLARGLPQRALKMYVLFLAVLIAGAVGLSRIYLGVHWPTDVLAGWSAGAGWALAWWLVARWLQRRGEVERDVDGGGNGAQ